MKKLNKKTIKIAGIISSIVIMLSIAINVVAKEIDQNIPNPINVGVCPRCSISTQVSTWTSLEEKEDGICVHIPPGRYDSYFITYQNREEHCPRPGCGYKHAIKTPLAYHYACVR